MTGSLSHRISALCLVWALISANSLRAAPISVTDQKGRAIEIELVAVAGQSVTFRKPGDAKEFTLPVSNFAADSQELIRKEAGRIPVALPKIQAEVVIGKRRQKGDSYYMVTQEITATVKLTNPSLTIPIPKISGKIVFFGQDRRAPQFLSILSSQNVETPIKPGETVSMVMDGLLTRYDSDNKGSGNIGGAQYTGYILVLMDEAGNVVVNETTSGSLRQAITAKPGVLKQIITYSKGTLLTEKLDPAPSAANELRFGP